MMTDIAQIASLFQIDGTPVNVRAVTDGHINGTWYFDTDRGSAYILQRINDRVFRDVEGLMRNIQLVTAHLRRTAADGRRVLTLAQTREDRPYLSYDGGYYRVYENIGDSLCLSAPESPEDLRRSGFAFGEFQKKLADFPADSLTETIPHFHDTPDRFRQLREAIDEDRAGRLKDARPEVDFALRRFGDAGLMTDMQCRGELPLRVTHNDTKLNNVLLDRTTREPLCVIDLDTVMPGLAGNDFGDAVRFGASTAAEDETDLSLVHFSLPMYRAFADGFLAACGDTLEKAELETLPLAARLMTLECGVRFLTDFLNGDTYFRVTHGTHNLERARTQFRLVAEMEQADMGL